jgi:hypothetical protein
MLECRGGFVYIHGWGVWEISWVVRTTYLGDKWAITPRSWDCRREPNADLPRDPILLVTNRNSGMTEIVYKNDFCGTTPLRTSASYDQGTLQP